MSEFVCAFLVGAFGVSVVRSNLGQVGFVGGLMEGLILLAGKLDSVEFLVLGEG